MIPKRTILALVFLTNTLPAGCGPKTFWVTRDRQIPAALRGMDSKALYKYFTGLTDEFASGVHRFTCDYTLFDYAYLAAEARRRAGGAAAVVLDTLYEKYNKGRTSFRVRMDIWGLAAKTIEEFDPGDIRRWKWVIADAWDGEKEAQLIEPHPEAEMVDMGRPGLTYAKKYGRLRVRGEVIFPYEIPRGVDWIEVRAFPPHNRKIYIAVRYPLKDGGAEPPTKAR